MKSLFSVIYFENDYVNSYLLSYLFIKEPSHQTLYVTHRITEVVSQPVGETLSTVSPYHALQYDDQLDCQNVVFHIKADTMMKNS